MSKLAVELLFWALGAAILVLVDFAHCRIHHQHWSIGVGVIVGWSIGIVIQLLLL